MQVSRYAFTLNNYTNADLMRLRELAREVKYLIFALEEAPTTGTPHLQGYVVFPRTIRLQPAKAKIGQNAHLEACRGSSIQNRRYVLKLDTDTPNEVYEEFGDLPPEAGQTNRFENFKAWVLDQPRKPTAAMVASEFPSLFLQYGRVMEWIDLIYPKRHREYGDYRPHQRDLANHLEQEANDREILFIVDPTGGTGKSWFIKKWISEKEDLTQVLSIGKRDDIAYAIDESKRYFLFDLPRSQCEYLQYSILEQLKDRMVMSNKYGSRMKHLEHTPHVVVFTNEEPDMTKLSEDRYVIYNWS